MPGSAGKILPNRAAIAGKNNPIKLPDKTKERLEAKADGYDILQDFLCELPFSVEDCLDSEGKEILRIADGE